MLSVFVTFCALLGADNMTGLRTDWLTAPSTNLGSISGRGKQMFRAAVDPTHPGPGCFLLA